MLGFDLSIVLAVFGIFFLGGLIKGILGFGLPLITMSLLPFVVPVETAIVLSALVQPATNIGQLIQSGGIARAFQISWPVLLSLAPGVALGAWYLSSLDGQAIMLIVGVTVVAFSLYNLVGFTVTIPPSRKLSAGLATGFVAGIVGALTSINGPFFIMYLVGLGEGRQAFRSSIAMLFVVSGFLISSGFWAVGILTKSNVMLGLVSLVPAFAGMWVGNQIGDRIPNEAFRKTILLALLFIGFVFIFRGSG